MATYLTKNFTLEELTHSDTADAMGINNTPNDSVKENLKVLANALQSIRDLYGKPISINCAYRCLKVNQRVGGAVTSQHVTGYAADIRPSDGNMTDLKMCVMAWAKSHTYDQIILEQCNAQGVPSWIHFGVKHVTKGQRKQKLVAKKVNGKWTYSNYAA